MGQPEKEKKKKTKKDTKTTTTTTKALVAETVMAVYNQGVCRQQRTLSVEIAIAI